MKRKFNLFVSGILFLWISVIGGLCLIDAADANLKAGAAKVDITPPIGTTLSGFGARMGKPSTGVHDPLYARCLVLDNGKEKIGMVSIDTVLFQRHMYDTVSKRVEKETGIKYGNLLIAATHTHAGSGGLLKEAGPLLGAGIYKPEIYKVFIDKVGQCVVQANKNSKKASIGMGSGKVTDASVNRREKGGPIDPEVGILRVDDEKGNLMAVLVNFAAHPTIIGGQEYSADFPGAIYQIIETLYPGSVPIFLNGAQGNQGPGSPAGSRDDYDKARRVGYILASEAINVMEDMLMSSSVSIKLLNQELLMHKKIGFTTWIQAVVLNEGIFLSIPGEAYVEVGLGIKKRVREVGFKQVFIAGLSNDGLGYFPTKEWWHKHVYEAMMSLFGPDAAQFIEDQNVALAKKILSQSPWLKPTETGKMEKKTGK